MGLSLKNAVHETQAGYKAPQNSPRLRNDELVAKRIEELQARSERKAEMAAPSRDELIGILSEIVHAARNRLSEARTADGLATMRYRRNSSQLGFKDIDLSGHNAIQGDFRFSA